MACLVLNCVLCLTLVVYLSLGNERPVKMKFRQRANFTGGVLYNTAASSIVQCHALCMDHLPQCWALRFNDGVNQCDLLWHAQNQTPGTFFSDVNWKIFRKV